MRLFIEIVFQRPLHLVGRGFNRRRRPAVCLSVSVCLSPAAHMWGWRLYVNCRTNRKRVIWFRLNFHRRRQKIFLLRSVNFLSKIAIHYFDSNALMVKLYYRIVSHDFLLSRDIAKIDWLASNVAWLVIGLQNIMLR